MAKAKKPDPTGGTATDKTASSTAKSAGSMPKTTRSKPSGTSDAVVKKPLPAKASVPAKPAAVTAPAKSTASEPSKTPDPKPADVKPVDVKPTVKPEASVTRPSEPPKSDSRRVEHGPTPVSAPQPEPQKSGSVFWPLLMGGALATALGFIAAEANVLGTRGDSSELRGLLNKQQAQIEELQRAEPQTPEISFPEMDGLTAEVTTLSESLSAMEARLSDVEKRPIPSGSPTAAVAANEREIAALQASIEKQRSEIEGLLENALSVEEATAEAARNAALQAALTRVTAAINDGQPFASALADLEENGLSDIPAALTEYADNGLVTLINLQTRFPDTARTVRSTARANGSDEVPSGVTSFLRRQLGARSVAPREGTDPDAVLSRAEAAVRDGQLADALAELEALPENAQGAMQDWLADARARQAAESAAQDLSQRLTAN